MSDRFYAALFPADPLQADNQMVAADTLALCENGALLSLLKKEKKFQIIIKTYLGEAGREADLSEFDVRSTDPKYINLFMQILLRGFADLDEENSARLGLRAVNALKKQGLPQYANLAAFDMTTGKFKWLKLEEV